MMNRPALRKNCQGSGKIQSCPPGNGWCQKTPQPHAAAAENRRKQTQSE